MPIRPEERARYPKDWPAISRRIREKAGDRCEECGVQNHVWGWRDDEGRFHAVDKIGLQLAGHLKTPFFMSVYIGRAPGAWWSYGFTGAGRPISQAGGAWFAHVKVIEIVLTTMHLNHTPEDVRDENLRAACQRCHLIYDAAHHAKNAAATRAKRKAA